MVFRRYEMWLTKGSNRRIIKAINRSELYIELANGARLWFKSGDNHHGLYGEDVHAAIIDEGSRVTEEAINAVTTTLTATNGKLKIIGNPGPQGQIFHDLCRKAEKGELSDALYIHMNSLDAVAAGLISQSVVDRARERMHPVDFARDYMGVPPSYAKAPFYANFDPARHVEAGLQFDPRWPIDLSFDFNVNPMTCIACQHWRDASGWHVRVLKEYRLPNSDVYGVIEAINHDWGAHAKTFTGDATGSNRNVSGKAPFLIIRNGLLGARKPKTFAANPTHTLSRQHMAIAFRALDVKIDASCTELIKDLLLTECTDTGGIDKKQELKHGRGHLGDCLRYFVHAHLLKPITDNAKTIGIIV
jgi:hypothetical protein